MTDTHPRTKERRHVTITPFQQRVYAVVKRIPRGEVRSYRWVARKLGTPKLARAVGQALHRNPDPVRVPCHRVVRADGSLGGYAWGLAKKRRLLAQERLIRRRVPSPRQVPGTCSVENLPVCTRSAWHF